MPGCGPPVAIGTSLRGPEWREAWSGFVATEALPTRAALEMRCGESELRLTRLTDSVMVDGCGCRAMYVLAQSGYILNSTSGDCRVAPAE